MDTTVDICLILEGTYPYVVGGVSRWVQQIVTGLPHLEFALVHLHSGHSPAETVYEIPPNLREIVAIPVEPFHDARLEQEWRQRVMRLPDARVYHALSTGFAGVLGVQIKRALQRPLVLTEHGIYWREIASGADELECGFKVVGGDTLAGSGGALLGLAASREHWTQTLRELARHAYRAADAITTVCEANRRLQLGLGAPADRCRVIPNGVETDARAGRLRLADAPRRDADIKDEPHFGFVGRVTAIKRVDAFLRAAAKLRRKYPRARFTVVGPLDHDRAYAAECRALARSCGLPDSVFVGQSDPYAFYPDFTALVLTSVSEGLPYAALEAMSCGTPIIATDVGGCRELICGQDDGIGPAGILTPPDNARATAKAMEDMAADPHWRRQLGAAGHERVRTHFSLTKCLAAYGKLYRDLVGLSAAARARPEAA